MVVTRRCEGHRLVVASHNPGKVREIEELLRPCGFRPLSAAGFYLDAIGRFTTLCRAMPDSPGPHEALARAYDSVGLMGPAAEEYRRALELSRSP